MNTKSQVTLFIILGIFILFLVFLVYSFSGHVSETGSSASLFSGEYDTKTAENYITSCVKKTLLSGVEQVGLNTDSLQSFIEKNIDSCIDEKNFKVPGMEIHKGIPQASIILSEENLFVHLHYQYQFMVRGKSSELTDFSVSIPLQTLQNQEHLSPPTDTLFLSPELSHSTFSGHSLTISLKPNHDNSLLSFGPVYDIQPHETEFNSPIAVEFDYSHFDFSSSITHDLVAVSQFDSSLHAWKPLPTMVDSSRKRLVSEMYHLGEVIITSLRPGCYLQLATTNDRETTVDKKLFIAESEEDCRSFSLAYSFAPLPEALTLTIKEIRRNPAVYTPETERILWNELQAPLPDRTYSFIFVSYVERNIIHVTSLSPSSSTDHCEKTIFFGVPLYCFNEIDDVKENNYPSLLLSLVFLKLGGTSDFHNPLTKDQGEPFDLLAQNQIELVDATQHDVFQPPIQTGTCEFDTASHQFTDEQYQEVFPYLDAEMQSGVPFSFHPDLVHSVVFVCNVNTLQENVRGSGVLFHEANHRYFGSHVYGIDDQSCRKKCSDGTCGESTLPLDYSGRYGDHDENSVYGAHISYLLDLSHNDLLKCQDRKEAYQEAQDYIQSSLCSGASFSSTEPSCSDDEQRNCIYSDGKLHC